MRETVAVATVDGRAYFLVVNELRGQGIPFVSLVPGESLPAKVKAVITTEKEKRLIKNGRLLVFQGENNLSDLIDELKRILQGKDAYERIVIGIDPGEAIGLAVIADGKTVEERNCVSPQEVVNCIVKILRSVDLSVTAVSVRIGSGVPIHREIVQALEDSLPAQVVMEVVDEAGTNRPLKENKRSRKIRHISSAIRIAGRTGYVVPRRNLIATDSRT